MPYRWIYCLLIPLGATARVDLVWAWGDLMNVLQVFPNMVGLIGLSGFVATVARARITRERAAAPRARRQAAVAFTRYFRYSALGGSVP